MSADSHTGRDPYTNAGSDTAKHYGGNIMDRFNRATPTPVPTEQGTPRVRDLPIGPSSEGSIKNR
ncbi:hypothetical protein B0G71_4366 [Paraburkholderia sp. BL27I4N3]|uniref:hypothetical protein n=1 Tax=Paraburkholderia sp. BL27I4N3 TaxID=1938805 RepID=UPI000E26E3ED|nr:hypothetical protein [Paraburkholderia sp. BL27I4N3]REE21214.1 hypothetical protein B0G71_4366 [Paraburkholderia sp. BL27I4N3]